MSDNVFLGGNAAILQSIVDGTPYDEPIQSPIEALLLQVKEVIEAGGGGGTTNYDSLTNKPKINGEELEGNLSGDALGLLTISNTMPTAAAVLEGQQLLYVGNTTSEYTKGLIYECQEVTPATSPKSYTWVAISAVSIEIDAALSTTSENPVQNKIVTAALNGKLDIASSMQTAAAALVGKQVLYVGATDAEYTKGCIYECQEDSGSYSWEIININDIAVDDVLNASSANPVQNSIVTNALNKRLVIAATLPAASAALVGEERLYVGTTQASYTKGLIYECQEVTPATDPATYTWVAISAVSIEIDNALSTTSENPVQNKVVTIALNGKLTIAATMPTAAAALEGQQRLYVGATSLDYTKGLIYECQEVTPTTDPATYTWVAISNIPIEIDAALSITSENPVQNKVVTLALGSKLSIVTSMGTASAELLGAELLYVGATDANFTKGCIYECQEVTPATDPKTYHWVAINVNDITVDGALSASSANPVENQVIYKDIYEQLYTTIAGIENNDKGAMELYSQNLNNIVTSGFYNAMTCTNAPFNYCMLIVCGYYLAGYCSQIAIDATTGAVRFRNQINGTWGAWDDLTQVDGTTITKDATTKQISAAVATAIAVGVVKPDGESTSVDENGNLSVINRLIVTDSIPTAAAALEGQQRLYIGSDTATLSKGVIYECQEVTPATDPKTYTWVALTVPVEFDVTPTQNSGKLITSGGVYAADAVLAARITDLEAAIDKTLYFSN